MLAQVDRRGKLSRKDMANNGSNDSDEDSDASHASLYDDGKGETKEERIEWHKNFCAEDGGSCGDHYWEVGKYDVRCENCRFRCV